MRKSAIVHYSNMTSSVISTCTAEHCGVVLGNQAICLSLSSSSFCSVSLHYSLMHSWFALKKRVKVTSPLLTCLFPAHVGNNNHFVTMISKRKSSKPDAFGENCKTDLPSRCSGAVIFRGVVEAAAPRQGEGKNDSFASAEWQCWSVNTSKNCNKSTVITAVLYLFSVPQLFDQSLPS